MTFADLPTNVRLAIRDLCEAHGARIEHYCNGAINLSMKPSADRCGWSVDAANLQATLLALGFERLPGGWRWPTDIPGDPMADRRGYLFSAGFRPTRQPFPTVAAVEEAETANFQGS